MVSTQLLISEPEILLRLGIAALLGGIIGLERERHAQPAGFRTHMILAIGAALAMCLSVNIAMEFREFVPNGDPGRIAAQVISGIGFLGGGAIIKYGSNIKGLTTATSLWTLSIIGLTVGAGHFLAAGVATVLLLTFLSLLDWVEKHFIVQRQNRTIIIEIKDKPHLFGEIKTMFNELKIDLKSLGFTKDVETQHLHIEAIAKIPTSQDIDRLLAKISHLPDIKNFKIE